MLVRGHTGPHHGVLGDFLLGPVEADPAGGIALDYLILVLRECRCDLLDTREAATLAKRLDAYVDHLLASHLLRRSRDRETTPQCKSQEEKDVCREAEGVE